MAFVLSISNALGVGAQHPSVPPGARVRLKLAGLESVTLTGRVEQLRKDSLYLQAERPLWLGHYVLALTDLNTLELSEGVYTHATRGALVGGFLGGALGVAGGFANGDEPTISAREQAVAGGVALGVLGAGVGALIGSHAHYERWVSVALGSLRVAPAPKGAGVAVFLSF